MQVKFLLITVLFFSCINFLQAQDTTRKSFEQQNKKSKYISFSLGMGANYSNNPDIIRFAGYRIPFYSTLRDEEKFSDFSTGLEFFGGLEYQAAKNFSLKLDYSYYLKTISLAANPNYDFSFTSHQPYLVFNYVIPKEYSFIKLGAGIGYLVSDFTAREFNAESKYTSTGIGIKLEPVFNLQISNSVGGYLAGSIFKTITKELEDVNGDQLKDANNQTVNLDSFGIGIRLGVEIFIF